MRAVALVLLVGCKSAMPPLDGHAWVSRDRKLQVLQGEPYVALRGGESIPLTGGCIPKEIDTVVFAGDRVIALDWHMTGSIYHSTGAILDTACVFDLTTRKTQPLDGVFPTVEEPDRRGSRLFAIGERTGWLYSGGRVHDLATKTTHPIAELERGGCDLVELDGKARFACLLYLDNKAQLGVITLSTAAFPPTEIARELIEIGDTNQVLLSRDGAHVVMWNGSAQKPGVLVDVGTSRRHAIPVPITALDFDAASSQLAVVVQPRSDSGGDIVVFDLGASGLTERKRIHVDTDAPLDEFAWLADGTFRIGSYSASRVVR